MKKIFIALLLAGIAWVAPTTASALDRGAVVPAVYTGTGENQFQLVGKRHRHKRHHRHRSSHRHDRHRHHDDHRHYDHYHGHHHHHDYYRRSRDYYISVPGLGSFYYSR